MDPWKGSFTVTEPGIWRFTFDGVVQFVGGFDRASIILYAGQNPLSRKANSIASAGDFNSLQPISINALVQVEANETVQIEFDGDGGSTLFSVSRNIRWTGTYLGSGVPTPPMCEYDGQTYEFPGSCRLYYLCPNDGPIEITSCCPGGVYSPSVGGCVSEEEAEFESLCAPLDICD